MTPTEERLLTHFEAYVGGYRLIYQSGHKHAAQVLHLETLTGYQEGQTARAAGDVICVRAQRQTEKRLALPPYGALCSRCAEMARKIVLNRKFAGHYRLVGEIIASRREHHPWDLPVTERGHSA